MHEKRVIVPEHAEAGTSLVEAGPFLFTSGCDGYRDPESGSIDLKLRDAVEAQCENSYGAVARLLRQAGLGMESVVRLDHFTSSQDWLPRRQVVRARIFGKPAPLTSTGVAARMAGINMVTTAAIAVRPPAEKRVVVSGPEFGMENISSAVAAGPFLFVAGLRGAAYERLRAILQRSGATADRILRIECFVRDGCPEGEARAVRRSTLGDEAWALTTVALPLGGRGDLEVTAIALAPGQGDKHVIRMPESGEVAAVGGGGFIFVGSCPGLDPDDALDRLAERLRLAGADLAAVVRMDVHLGDIAWAGRLRSMLHTRFADGLPALVVAGADPGNDAPVSMSAIAVQREKRRL
jgi:enamine deaminase RidA (YjgF/YER057c/UK114 family)